MHGERDHFVRMSVRRAEDNGLKRAGEELGVRRTVSGGEDGG